MTCATKIDALLHGQTNIARKLFEFVPIGDAWTEHQVVGSMARVTGSKVDMRVARACLRDLAEAGLIYRRNDQYRRSHAPEQPQQKEVEMPSAKAAHTLPVRPATKAEALSAASPIEILGDIAGAIVALGKSVADQLQQLASRVEEAAIQIEQGQEANAANLQKLKQLQQLLRSLGDEA